MFQKHIFLDNGGVGRGPVFGHVVSHDLAHWATLDVSVWNDEPYGEFRGTHWDVAPTGNRLFACRRASQTEPSPLSNPSFPNRSADDVAIYTGSATIVNGTPTIVYPGLCAKKPSYPQCDGGQDHCHLAVAVPANDSDPLCEKWTKPDFNPIVNSTQRDPSGAWMTPSGRWRMVTLDEHVYESADASFASWTFIGTQVRQWDYRD